MQFFRSLASVTASRVYDTITPVLNLQEALISGRTHPPSHRPAPSQ